MMQFQTQPWHCNARRIFSKQRPANEQNAQCPLLSVHSLVRGRSHRIVPCVLSCSVPCMLMFPIIRGSRRCTRHALGSRCIRLLCFPVAVASFHMHRKIMSAARAAATVEILGQCRINKRAKHLRERVLDSLKDATEVQLIAIDAILSGAPEVSKGPSFPRVVTKLGVHRQAECRTM